MTTLTDRMAALLRSCCCARCGEVAALLAEYDAAKAAESAPYEPSEAEIDAGCRGVSEVDGWAACNLYRPFVRAALIAAEKERGK